MMKKLLFILISLLCLLAVGCGSGTPAAPPKPSFKEEAKNFDKVYMQEDYYTLRSEFFKASIDSFKKYGNTRKADEEFLKLGYDKKVEDLKAKISQAKIEHQEVQPLKNLLVKAMDPFMVFIESLQNKNSQGVNDSVIKILQTEFAYRNNYSMIVDGKPLPVVNSSSGQLYAYETSNVLLGIAKVKEANSIGDSYFSEDAHGKFIIVTVAVFNNQKDAIAVDASEFKLIDKEKREYSASRRGMTALQMSNKQHRGFLEQLNPNMGFESTIVFDVPKNTGPDDYELQAAGGFTGDKILMPVKSMHNGY